MSVANVDYGWMGRVPELGRLSVLEELLLSPNRLNHVVVKVHQFVSLSSTILLTRGGCTQVRTSFGLHVPGYGAL